MPTVSNFRKEGIFTKRRVTHDQREDKVIGEGQKIRVWLPIDRRDGVVIIFFLHRKSFLNIGAGETPIFHVIAKTAGMFLHKGYLRGTCK